MAYSYKLDRLREIREQKRLSLIDLALMFGVQRGSIEKYERGEARASKSTRYKLATALGVGTPELMEGDK
jgi:transcriptional regulator with XRE-family HTH domain